MLPCSANPSPKHPPGKERCPGTVLADPSVSPEVAALAALLAGEPRRARKLLDGSADTPEHRALRHLADVLDVNWFPGGTGATEVAPDATILSWEPPGATGDPARDLLLRLIGDLQPTILSLRSNIRSSYRVNATRAPEAAAAITGEMQALMQQAHAAGRIGIAGFCSLILSDLFRLAGADAEASRYRDWARSAYEIAADPVGSGLVDLLEGDSVLTPTGSPEVFGFDLEDLTWSAPPTDATSIQRARRCYASARRAFADGLAPRGEAAVDIREAFLDFAEGDAAGAETKLSKAEAGLADAGDEAGAQLVRILAIVLAISEGRLSAAGSGVGDDLDAWVRAGGSRSYGSGLGRLVHAAGRMWRSGGDVERASALLRLAANLALLCANPLGQVSALGDMADLFADLNSRGPSIAILERY